MLAQSCHNGKGQNMDLFLLAFHLCFPLILPHTPPTLNLLNTYLFSSKLARHGGNLLSGRASAFHAKDHHRFHPKPPWVGQRTIPIWNSQDSIDNTKPDEPKDWLGIKQFVCVFFLNSELKNSIVSPTDSVLQRGWYIPCFKKIQILKQDYRPEKDDHKFHFSRTCPLF